MGSRIPDKELDKIIAHFEAKGDVSAWLDNNSDVYPVVCKAIESRLKLLNNSPN